MWNRLPPRSRLELRSRFATVSSHPDWLAKKKNPSLFYDQSFLKICVGCKTRCFTRFRGKQGSLANVGLWRAVQAQLSDQECRANIRTYAHHLHTLKSRGKSRLIMNKTIINQLKHQSKESCSESIDQSINLFINQIIKQRSS